MRINRFLASCGIGSRRKVEEYISAGQIKVNGVVITNLATEVTDTDVVEYKGKNIKPVDKKLYIMLNKPKGYICSLSDEKDRPTVVKLIKENTRVYPVGRLDYNTEGLLLLTNDGDFANKIMHPSGRIGKTYEVTLKVKPKTEHLDILRRGVELEDGITQPAIIEHPKAKDGLYVLNITIFEGKNREVRRMFKAVGYNVFALKRIKIGKLELGDLPTKSYKLLNDSEINKLFKWGRFYVRNSNRWTRSIGEK